MVKEDALLSGRQHMWVFTAIPFGMIDDSEQWIPNPSAYQPNIGLTRIYWKEDIVKALDEFEQAKLHSREEFWVKDREEELEFILRGIHKLESFEADVRQNVRSVEEDTNGRDRSGNLSSMFTRWNVIPIRRARFTCDAFQSLYSELILRITGQIVWLMIRFIQKEHPSRT